MRFAFIPLLALALSASAETAPDEALFRRAEEARAAGRTAEAIKDYTEIFTRYTNSPHATQARFLSAMGHRGVERLKLLLELDSDRVDLATRTAALYHLGAETADTAALEKCVKLDPKGQYAPYANLRYGMLLNASDDPAVRRKGMEVILGLAFGNGVLADEALYFAAIQSYREKRYDEAKALFLRYRRNHPEGEHAAEALSMSAWCELKEGRTAAAAALCDEGESDELAYIRAACAYTIGDNDTAFFLFRKYLDDYPQGAYREDAERSVTQLKFDAQATFVPKAYPGVRVRKDMPYGARRMLPTEGFASRNAFLATNEWGFVQNGHCTGQDYDLYLPAGPQTNLPVLVYIHGGGWCQPFDKTDHEEFFELIANDGWAVFAPDYIMQPDLITDPSETPRPGATMAAQLRDIDLMMKEVRRVSAACGFDVSHLVLAGESAGAHLASLYASDAVSPEVLGLSLEHPLDIRRLFNIVGFIDFTDTNACPCATRAFGPRWTPDLYRSWLRAITGTEATEEDLSRYSPARHIVSGLPPHLISYSCRADAQDDGIVPVSMYVTLTNSLKRAGVPFAARLFPGTSHCETMLPPAAEARQWYLSELRKFRP